MTIFNLDIVLPSVDKADKSLVRISGLPWRGMSRRTFTHHASSPLSSNPCKRGLDAVDVASIRMSINECFLAPDNRSLITGYYKHEFIRKCPAMQRHGCHDTLGAFLMAMATGIKVARWLYGSQYSTELLQHNFDHSFQRHRRDPYRSRTYYNLFHNLSTAEKDVEPAVDHGRPLGLPPSDKRTCAARWSGESSPGSVVASLRDVYCPTRMLIQVRGLGQAPCTGLEFVECLPLQRG